RPARSSWAALLLRRSWTCARNCEPLSLGSRATAPGMLKRRPGFFDREFAAMKTFVRCGHLFTGREDEARKGETLVFGEHGMLDFAGPEEAAPRRARNDHVLDYSAYFVMPGLVDVHTHLAYGNAKSEEDIDLYSPLEFRTLRGMFFAQKVAAAG